MIRFSLMLVWFGASSFAQSTAGLAAVRGAVVDATGSAVADARVTVSNGTLGIQRQFTTNAAGAFTAASLPPSGGYRITADKAGFATFELRDLELQVGQIADFRIQMQVAATETRVEVVADAVSVSQTKTGVSDVITSRQILDLPINGRRVDTFVLLTPAVVPEGNFGLISFRGIPGGNAFLTDGNDTTNQLWNENAGRTRIASNISQDAVQEFEVLSNNYSAEFGRAVGGVVNTVTRSGSNETHGTGFWFFRNQALNARDPFAATNPQEQRNQFGGSIGGPIVRDKLFYFANVELTRRDFPIESSLNRPPLFDGAGNFIGQCGASPQQCDAAISSFSRLFTIVERTANNNLGFAKLDWRPSDVHNVSASFNLLNWNSPNGIQTGAVLNSGAGVGNNGNSEVKTRFARLAWTAIASPNLVNEFRFGWFKDRLFDSLNPDLIPPTGIATITVQGVANLGSPNFLPRVFPTEDRFQVANTLSWTTGNHLVKFGFDFSHVRDVQEQVFNGNGSYVYANFTNFALDFSGNAAGAKRWQSYSQGFGPPLVDTWIQDYMFFLQDQWRVSRRLTLNYGLRTENYRFAQPEVGNPDYPQTRRINQPFINLAPRFGFAWTPFGDKTVLRGGYGIFYARTPGGLINWLHRDNANFQFTIFLQGNIPSDVAVGPVFPNRLPETDRAPAPGTVSMTFAEDNWRTPYTQQADFGIERQLGSKMSLTASYVWSRGVAFTTIRDSNIGPEGPPVTYQIRDASGANVGAYTTPTYRRANLVDPRYQRIGVLESRGNTWYNALAVQWRRRQSQWLDGSIAYTWSHALDQNLGFTGDNLFFGSQPRTVFDGNFSNEKGTSEIDQRHRFVFNTISDLRFGMTNPFAKFAIDNWQFSQILTLASGPFATPSVFVSGTPFAGAAFNTTLNGLGGSSRVPFQGRTSIEVGALRRWDFRLSKVFPITERVSTMFLFEVFNATNTPTITSVLTQAFQASAGVLTPTPRLGEGTQSAGFPDGTNARRAQIGLRVIF
jgi:hypothetical protein